MVPKINNQGHSFKGLIAYLMHDQKSPETSERVRWYETGNMLTDDPEKAAIVMAWTDMHSDELKAQSGGSTAGRKTTKGAVYHFSLAWHGDEIPNAEHQQNFAREALAKLKLQDHEHVLVAHNDTDHDHVHVVVNLTHPQTGKRADLKFEKINLQQLALQYEKEHGIYCEQRLENEREREKARLTKQVTRAYELSDNGKSFQAALKAEGLTLAAGRKQRIVFIDEKGKIQNVSRFLKTDEKSPTKALKSRFADLDQSMLPDADRVAEEKQAKNQKALSDAAYQFDKAQKVEELKKEQEQRAQATQKQQETKKAAQRTKEENLKRYIERIDEQTIQSREKWNIDTLSRARDEAKAAHEKGQGWRTGAALEKAEKALKEGQEKFRAELLGIHGKRPKWAIEGALKEQGLSPVVTEKDIEYMREVEAAQKRERAEAALKSKYYEEIFEKKAAASRKEWAIDELIKEREEAQRAIDKGNVFHAEDAKRKAAGEDLKAAEKILDNHMKWFRDDLILINRNRAPWAIKKELEKQGLPTDDLETAIAQAHERAERLREKQASYYNKKKEFEALERVRALNRQIRIQTEKSRKHWGIDKAIEDKEAAQKAFEQAGTMRGIITGRKRQAAENLEVATRTHRDRMHNFKNEVLWFNRMKPKEEIREALRVQGLEKEYPLPKRDMRTPAEIEADEIRQKSEKKRQREAEKQAEAKQRFLAKRRKELQQEREQKNRLAMQQVAQSRSPIELQKQEEGIGQKVKKQPELEKSKPVEVRKTREQEKQRGMGEFSRNFDLSMEDRLRAIQAARSGELGEKYKQMANEKFDAEKRLEIRKAWIEAQRLAVNDNEPSIQQEQSQEIDKGQELEL